MKLTQEELNRILSHMQNCDSWLRELHGWRWHRRSGDGSGDGPIDRKMAKLTRSIKQGEKIVADLQKHEP